MTEREKLVERLRSYAETADGNIYGICINTPIVLTQAADAIEALMQENAKLKAELDAAVSDMESIANNMLVGCEYCKKGCTSWKDCHFEWRGVKEDTDAEEQPCRTDHIEMEINDGQL